MTTKAINSQTESTSLMAATPLPRSMKGYNLYSWKSEGGWNFTLITGSNALPTVKLIMTGPERADDWVLLRSRGIEEIKRHLGRLPQNADVLWSGKYMRGPFELPPARIVEEIKAYCDQLGMTLLVAP